MSLALTAFSFDAEFIWILEDQSLIIEKGLIKDMGIH